MFSISLEKRLPGRVRVKGAAAHITAATQPPTARHMKLRDFLKCRLVKRMEEFGLRRALIIVMWSRNHYLRLSVLCASIHPG